MIILLINSIIYIILPGPLFLVLLYDFYATDYRHKHTLAKCIYTSRFITARHMKLLYACMYVLLATIK